MQLSGSVDMQFCFSVLFFVLLTFLATYRALSRRRQPSVNQSRSNAHSADEYAAQVQRLKDEEKGA
jgi:hypothetical protein